MTTRAVSRHIDEHAVARLGGTHAEPFVFAGSDDESEARGTTSRPALGQSGVGGVEMHVPWPFAMTLDALRITKSANQQDFHSRFGALPGQIGCGNRVFVRVVSRCGGAGEGRGGVGVTGVPARLRRHARGPRWPRLA